MSKFTRIHHADGRVVDVTTNIGDTLAFESVLRKNKSWGTLTENTMTLFHFKAWNALKRSGDTISWDEFSSGSTAALDVTSHDTEDETEDQTEDELEVAGVGFDTATGAPQN